MCYSAMVYAEIKSLERRLGVKIDEDWYVQTFWIDKDKNPWKHGKPPPRPKVPRAMEIGVLNHGPARAADLIREWDAAEIDYLTQHLFSQRRRVADAERKLTTKVTKKTLEDVRIGTNEVRKAQERLEELKKTTSESGMGRIFPRSYAPVIVFENDQRVVKPMRYQCRIAGAPASIDFTKDGKPSGTYNARRDNLERFWRNQFGHTHAIMVADRFYEHVQIERKDQILEFNPLMNEPMLVACLWSHWVSPDGTEELLSFAAITDEPPAEIAAAGHDRCIIPIKPEHVDAWLQPSGDRPAMFAILDDRERPYYEHRMAA